MKIFTRDVSVDEKLIKFWKSSATE